MRPLRAPRLKVARRTADPKAMSIEAVVGRIDQIYQLQQQVLDPSAASASSSSDGGAAVSSGSGSSSVATDFATALANAQQATSTTSADDTADPTDSTDQGSDAASVQSLLSALNAATAAGATGTTDSSVTGSATSTDPLLSLLAAAGASATASTASGVVGAGATTAASTGSTAPAQVDAMVQEANSLVGKPYVWGGGHSGWGAQSGYDCSGFVSAVLHAGGYLSSPQDTETLPTAAGIASGPGQYVTIYDRTTPGQEGHVIIDIAGQFYESGGESGTWGGGGGVEKIATPPASYLATFNTILHPEGL